MDKKEWQKIVNRGPIVLPTFEPSQPDGLLYVKNPYTGEINKDYILGYMPKTYYDKKYIDWQYHSFTAVMPFLERIGLYKQGRYDEDEQNFDDYDYFEIEDDPYEFMTEKDFIGNNYAYIDPVNGRGE